MARYILAPQNEELGESNPNVVGQKNKSLTCWGRLQCALPALACLCMLVGACLSASSGQARHRRYFFGDKLGNIEQLFSDDPCKDFEYISIDRIIHKNLGNSGPDTGAEGMVYEGVDQKRNEPGKPVIMVLNATSLLLTDAKGNGMNGQYATVGVQGNTDVKLTFKFYDGVTMKPMNIPQLYFTFFDLDTHATGNEVEYVRVWDHKDYILTTQTHVSTTEEVDGSTTFVATVPGTGADNPEDPLLLTSEQKKKAVTVQFQDVSDFHVEFGSKDKVENLVDRW
eukprot:CAMPEP_0172688288 /NCGR_PEP_ID=MMETSP1074-20121228/22316_1 /TAXON_ID=2916 /ORGANISM="Ceratium fusus, Strain PA161109" /LENGTH=281 /DNA_ID=CAMNT_0013507901 /DNA_START=38 /DNA_END=880 /DNA_ORIENTATION=-